MTQADRAQALRMSLDSGPVGQGQALVVETAALDRWARCCRCGQSTNRPVNVGVIETGSGPGVMVYADIRCAATLARRTSAPQWLKDKFRGRAA